MNEHGRRKFLTISVGSGITLLAGCGGSDDQGGGDDSSSRTEMVSTQYEVAEDEHAVSSPFSSDQEETVEYSFSVTSGPEVDVYLATQSGVDNYEATGRFDPLSHISGTDGEDTITTNQFPIRIIVDNTEVGDVSPPTDLDDNLATVTVQAWFI